MVTDLPAHLGQGAATEAMAAVVDWAYQNLDLNRLQTEVDTRNPPSARVLEKLGFTRQPVVRYLADATDGWEFAYRLELPQPA